MKFSNKNSAEASSSTDLQNQHISIIDQSQRTQLKFGSFSPCINDRPLTEESGQPPCLMEKFLRQAELEDAQEPEYLCLGSFKCIIKAHYPSPPQCFLASAFKYAPPHLGWPPTLSAHHKADLAQACYTKDDVLALDTNWAILCARCLQWGHKKISCQARVICINCSTPDHKVSNCPLWIKQQSTFGLKSTVHGNHTNHIGFSEHTAPPEGAPPKPTLAIRCDACGHYGHVARSCYQK